MYTCLILFRYVETRIVHSLCKKFRFPDTINRSASLLYLLLQWPRLIDVVYA